MHGLQTIQKLNDAASAIAAAKRNAPVTDVVEGFFIFEPHGYEVVYHTSNRLPEEGRAFLSIEFKGEDARGARFDVTPAEGPTACNRSLADTVELAGNAGLDRSEVETRLKDLFVSGINDN